jgi:DNA-binding transcriptional ArsR family regulator
MAISQEEFEALKQRLDSLERRLDAQRNRQPSDDFEWPVKGDEGEPPEEGKAFFADLRNRLGDVEKGLVSIIGGVYRFAPGKNIYWQSRLSNYPLELPLIDCSDEDAAQFASIFSSIQRLRLLEAMVGAAQSASELRSKTGLGSGALYHHLRGLTHAGFAEKRGRGRYTLTAAGMTGIITFLHVASERSRKPRSQRSQPSS